MQKLCRVVRLRKWLGVRILNVKSCSILAAVPSLAKWSQMAATCSDLKPAGKTRKAVYSRTIWLSSLSYCSLCPLFWARSSQLKVISSDRCPPPHCHRSSSLITRVSFTENQWVRESPVGETGETWGYSAPAGNLWSKICTSFISSIYRVSKTGLS